METDLYDEYFRLYGNEHAIDWKLLKAQVKAESSFNAFAQSGSGAKGLAQFMPNTWKEWGSGDIYDPENNIKAQARYMAHLLPIFGNRVDLALASYNWGMGNLRHLMLEMRSSDLDTLSSSPKFPRETKTYVERVMRNYSYYTDKERKEN